MTEGEEFIEDYFLSEKIKCRKELRIDGLKNDSKSYRVADFYLPDWILRTIVYHLFQCIVYQCFSPKFTTVNRGWENYFSPKFTSSR